MSDSHPAHLEPSKLGTKDYWDDLYATELQNHASNPSDTGTTWFSDSAAEEKLLSHLSDLSLPPTTSFLDLGCGNGSLLTGLRSEGWEGRLMGVDYSAQSVELARRVASQEDSGAEFAVWDLLGGDYAAVLSGEETFGWDVVTDKGTFDAICLASPGEDGRRICEDYRPRVLRLVKKGGLFIITSCNWTEDELRAWFVGGEGEGEGGFAEEGRIEYRSFSFGGHKGQTISTLCFRRT